MTATDDCPRPPRLGQTAADGGPSGSSPPPSSWSSWTPRSSASPCPRCRPTSASRRRTCPGCSTPTSSRSAACCCSAAGCPTCSAPAACSPPAGPSCSPVPLSAGLADAVAVELAGRAVQGAGAALIAPAALTLLMMLFGAEPRELTKALALYGAAAPAGGTAGVFLGGVITEYASWPWVFYINIPIAAGRRSSLTPALMPAGAGHAAAASTCSGRADRHRRPGRRRLRHRPRPRGRLDLRRRRWSGAGRRGRCCSAAFVAHPGRRAATR